jgi:hypothetical protein
MAAPRRQAGRPCGSGNRDGGIRGAGASAGLGLPALASARPLANICMGQSDPDRKSGPKMHEKCRLNKALSGSDRPVQHQSSTQGSEWTGSSLSPYRERLLTRPDPCRPKDFKIPAGRRVPPGRLREPGASATPRPPPDYVRLSYRRRRSA